MSRIWIIVGIIWVGSIWAGSLHAQPTREARPGKVLIVSELTTHFPDSGGSQAEVSADGQYRLWTFSLEWRDGQLFLLFQGLGATGTTYMLEADITPDRHYKMRLRTIDARGQVLPFEPTDQLLLLNHAPGKSPRPLIGRISFWGVSAGTVPAPSTWPMIVRGNFRILPDYGFLLRFFSL